MTFLKQLFIYISGLVACQIIGVLVAILATISYFAMRHHGINPTWMNRLSPEIIHHYATGALAVVWIAVFLVRIKP